MIAALTGCVAPRPAPVACDPPAPAGASVAAQEYAAAAHDALEARRVLSDTIAAQDMMMSLDDMATAASIDTDFLADVRDIRFPRSAAAIADDFVRAVEADDVFLRAAAAQDGHYGAHLDERETLLAERNHQGERLRDALGLPQSSCALNLP